jgi:hypothetical protein
MTTNSEAAVEAAGLVKASGTTRAVDGVDLVVPRGGVSGPGRRPRSRRRAYRWGGPRQGKRVSRSSCGGTPPAVTFPLVRKAIRALKTSSVKPRPWG